MANVKFSQFSATTLSATGFIVGYDSVLNDNIRFTLSQLETALTLDNITGALNVSKAGMLTGGTTGQVLAKLNNTDYGLTWKNLTASDVSGVATTRDVLRYISTTDTAAVTGSTALTLIRSQLIPAGTFQVGDIITIRQRLRKTGTAGLMTGGIYVNTISSVTGASQLGIYTSSGITNPYIQMKRELFIKTATNTESVWTNTSLPIDDVTTTQAAVATNINWAVDQYIIFTSQAGAAGDSIIQSGFIIELL